MCSYNVIVPDFKVKKANRDELRVVERATSKLLSTLNTYDMNGICFEKIFNDDVVKHNCLDNNMYVYKFSDRNKSQLRLLYQFQRVDNDNANIRVIDYYFKRRDTRGTYKTKFREKYNC